MDAPRDRVTDYRLLKSINGVGIDVDHAFYQHCYNYAAYDWTFQAAETLASSHRKFHVGAMIVANDPANCRMGLFFGGNTQLRSGDHPEKLCAERMALRKVREAQFPVVVGVAVFGPNQPDKHTGRLAKTLPPCGICRAEFQAAKEMSPTTQIVTYGAGEIMEHCTLEHFLREYGVPSSST